MEIGGYRELDLRNDSEYYEHNYPARLNSGRSGIYHALRCLNCQKIMLPYYQCETVRTFLIKKGIEVTYYHIDEDFLPQVTNAASNTAILIVNYFGLLKESCLKVLKEINKNVIFDNTQAFYQHNLDGAYSVYSPRKFFGVSDGAYVVGKDAERFTEEYPQDQSALTAGFLLSRIETGGNANYTQYLVNEERIENSDCLNMSKLTQALLKNVPYEEIAARRKINYDFAAGLFRKINNLANDFLKRESQQVPMVYPLVIPQEKLRFELKEQEIFVGQWWKYLLEEKKVNAFERWLSLYLLPIPIDQRYGPAEMEYTAAIIEQQLNL